MREFFRRRIVAPLRALLVQGVTPEKLAMSIAIGLIVGIFPVMGTTTVLCTAAAAVMRLNLVAVHTVHYAMTPVQLLLIIPFVRVGEHVVRAEPQPLTISEGMALLAQGVVHAVVTLWSAIVHAVIGWVVIGPLAIVLCYYLFRWILLRTSLARSTA
jgi:uncharacterized protein (DUF2062 family)